MVWGRGTAAAVAWGLLMGGEVSVGRGVWGGNERRTFVRERVKRSRGSGRGASTDANLDFFNLQGQQCQIKVFQSMVVEFTFQSASDSGKSPGWFYLNVPGWRSHLPVANAVLFDPALGFWARDQRLPHGNNVPAPMGSRWLQL